MFDSLKLHTSAIAGVGCVAIAFLFAAADAPVPAAPSVDNDEQVSFANDVLPIFEQRCAECHGAPGDDGEPRLESGLNLGGQLP